MDEEGKYLFPHYDAVGHYPYVRYDLVEVYYPEYSQNAEKAEVPKRGDEVADNDEDV